MHFYQRLPVTQLLAYFPCPSHITLGLTVLVVVVVIVLAALVVTAGSLEAKSVDWAPTWRGEPGVAGSGGAAELTCSGSLRISGPSPDADLCCKAPSLA